MSRRRRGIRIAFLWIAFRKYHLPQNSLEEPRRLLCNLESIEEPSHRHRRRRRQLLPRLLIMIIQQAAMSVTAVAAIGIRRRRQISRRENDPDLSSISSLTLQLLLTAVLEDLDIYHLRRTPIALVVRPIHFRKESLVTSSQVHTKTVRSMLLPKTPAIVHTILIVRCGEDQQVSWMLVLTTSSN
jgi:hypothetical protein